MNTKVTKEVKNIIKVLNLNCTTEEFKDKVNWYNISYSQKLSEDFIREFKDYVDWNLISKYQKLSESFIREFKDKVSWYFISQYQKLSADFIIEFQNYVHWKNISAYQKLSEDFMRKIQDKLDWIYISASQKLSENFIREFKDKVSWNNISVCQKLSESFIREFKDKIDWNFISKYQKISTKLRKEFNIIIYNTNWIYKPVNFKLKKLKEINKNKNTYEIIDNKCIIAYKGIRSDNYSKYNFQYKYEIGKTYKSHCDCNIKNENSFGLSAWTLTEAKYYCDEKIIKVKININDLGCIVHDGNKLRCRKFTVLEEVK